MNKEEILAMEAGRGLDVLVASEVFGLYASDKIYARDNRSEGAIFPIIAKPYSTDISAAWQVVEKMKEDGCVARFASWLLRLSHIGQSSYLETALSILITYGGLSPVNICKAALLASLGEDER